MLHTDFEDEVIESVGCFGHWNSANNRTQVNLY